MNDENIKYMLDNVLGMKPWTRSQVLVWFAVVILSVVALIVLSPTAQAQARYTLECDKYLLEASKTIALKQIGTKELTGKNDGVQVEKYLESVGLRKGAPYCAAGQYYCFRAAYAHLQPYTCINANMEIPIPKSGLANQAFSYAKKQGNRTKYFPEVHDLITWRKKNSWSGHIERVDSVGAGGWVWTIAFNTSNGKRGSQREGNGVFRRKRNIFHPLGRMRIRGLTGFVTKDMKCQD